ncbi:MAG: M23 family metallopeptidase, partial [Chitinophagaceae bacterium]
MKGEPVTGIRFNLTPSSRTMLRTLFSFALVSLLASYPAIAQETPAAPLGADTSYADNPRTPLEATFLTAPRLAELEAGRYLVYELQLVNFIRQPLLLDGLEVSSSPAAATVRTRISGEQLRNSLRNMGAQNDSMALQLEYGSRSTLFIWLPVPAGTLPTTLYHRLLIGGSRKYALTLAPLAVPKRATILLLDPPLRGTWVTAQGSDPGLASKEGHNKLLYPYGGAVRVPQRFAYDWAMLGADGKAYHGDSTRNENYAGFGAPVYAVADGIVVDAQEDVPENVPPLMTVPRTAKNVTGNFIVLSLKNGMTVFYGHLQTNSLTVRKGQAVRKGQIIARVGNTGNSSGAHLHFQVNAGNHF